MSVIDRANRDIDEGNHWLARQRLESHVSSVGYDPELLAKLGNIAHSMHDAFNAGRFWLTSAAEGRHVDEAVAVFMAHCGNDARTIASSLPRATRLNSLESYPAMVQERLCRLGIDLAVVAATPSALRPRAWGKWKATLIGILIVAIFLFCCVSCVVGARQIVQWLTDGGVPQ